MKLFIDTSNSEKVIVAIDGRRYEDDSPREKSQKILPFIDKILKKEGIGLKQITEIEVNTGPGSFTGLRVGVSVANTLGWVLEIPVNGNNLSKGEFVEIKYT